MLLRKRLAVIAVVVVTLAWAVGAVDFLRADGSFGWTMPRQAEPPVDEHNLASYIWGPTLRASSYFRDDRSHHHPAFLVDGVERPDPIEKWTSAPNDRSPWFEIRWREPRNLKRVVVFHGGSREGHHLTSRAYRIRCLSDRDEGATRDVTDNRDDIALHELACANARGVRVSWRLAAGDELVRVYEVEAWGR